MTVPDPAPGGQHADDDADRWQEAARLRREHPGWIVLWLARIGQYRACRRLPRARHDTTLTAPAPGDLAAQIRTAEQAARAPARIAAARPGHAQDRP